MKQLSLAVDVPIMNHAEDIFLRNNGVMNASITSNNLGLKGNTSLAEAVMVYRDLLLSQSLSSKLHLLHISTKQTVDLLKQFKKKGACQSGKLCLLCFTYHDKFQTYEYAKFSFPTAVEST